MKSRERATPDFFDGQVVKCAQIPGMSIGEIHYPAAWQRPIHTHERACFHFIFQGGCVERLGRESRECKTFTLAFQPKGYVHSYCGSAKPSRVLTIELEDAWLAVFGEYSVKLD